MLFEVSGAFINEKFIRKVLKSSSLKPEKVNKNKINLDIPDLNFVITGI